MSRALYAAAASDSNATAVNFLTATTGRLQKVVESTGGYGSAGCWRGNELQQLANGNGSGAVRSG